MPPVLRGASLLLSVVTVALAACAACGPPPSPKGPPPEYEDPPAPSWLERLDGGGPDAAPDAGPADAGTI